MEAIMRGRGNGPVPMFSAEIMERIKTLFVSGTQADDLARQFGVAPGTIRSWATRKGWIRDKASRQQTAASALLAAEKASALAVVAATGTTSLAGTAGEDMRRLTAMLDFQLERLPTIPCPDGKAVHEVARATEVLIRAKRLLEGVDPVRAPSKSINFNFFAKGFSPVAAMPEVVDV